ncbi:MAG TPA: hypothetical protein VN653_18655, partial [Anaerolineales bacterium]|nr:hypothetical protein [Anaerolineales bacterium]
LAQDNLEKALMYAALVEDRIQSESIALMEPDTIMLDKLLTTAKNKLDSKSFQQIIEKSKSLNVEELIAAELSATA